MYPMREGTVSRIHKNTYNSSEKNKKKQKKKKNKKRKKQKKQKKQKTKKQKKEKNKKKEQKKKKKKQKKEKKTKKNKKTNNTHSSMHGTFSRMDHVLGHKISLNKFERIEIISSIFFWPQWYETRNQPQGEKKDHMETKPNAIEKPTHQG